MRNYYDALGLHRGSEEVEALQPGTDFSADLEPDYAEDAASVLTDSVQQTHYRRLHLQYDAMAAVLQRGIPQKDTHSWSKRVVEFSPEPNELPD